MQRKILFQHPKFAAPQRAINVRDLDVGEFGAMSDQDVLAMTQFLDGRVIDKLPTGIRARIELARSRREPRTSPEAERLAARVVAALDMFLPDAEVHRRRARQIVASVFEKEKLP